MSIRLIIRVSSNGLLATTFRICTTIMQVSSFSYWLKVSSLKLLPLTIVISAYLCIKEVHAAQFSMKILEGTRSQWLSCRFFLELMELNWTSPHE